MPNNIIPFTHPVAVIGCSSCNGIHFCLAQDGQLVCSDCLCYMDDLMWMMVNEVIEDKE